MEYIRFTLRLNKDMNSELKEVSKKMNISKNSVINLVLSKYFEKIQK